MGIDYIVLFHESGKGHDIMNSLEYFKLRPGRATFSFELGCLIDGDHIG